MVWPRSRVGMAMRRTAPTPLWVGRATLSIVTGDSRAPLASSDVITTAVPYLFRSVRRRWLRGDLHGDTLRGGFGLSYSKSIMCADHEHVMLAASIQIRRGDRGSACPSFGRTRSRSAKAASARGIAAVPSTVPVVKIGVTAVQHPRWPASTAHMRGLGVPRQRNQRDNPATDVESLAAAKPRTSSPVGCVFDDLRAVRPLHRAERIRSLTVGAAVAGALTASQ